MDDLRTDSELVEAVRERGDRKALGALLERHQPAIWRFGMKMCRNEEDAKDVLQETMLAAARTAREFRGGSSVPTWLYAIARSCCIKKRRRSKFAPEGSVELDQASAFGAELRADGPSPDEAAATGEMAAALERALGELESSAREVILLRDVEGLTAPEVGEVLGLGVEAVKSRLHRARLALREKLAPLQDDRGATKVAESCPDILPVFSRYLEGEIGADECARMQKHVDDCPRCRGACSALKSTLSLCRAQARRESVPPAVQELVRKALREVAVVAG
jgi:RNA polymerase sigma-70 factor (ECF subfamily)